VTKSTGLIIWLTRLAWGLGILDLLLILVVPADTSFNSLLLLIAYAVWLILSLIAASTWLIIRYRALFRTWLGWAMPLVALLFSSMVFYDILPVRHANISLIFSLLVIVSGWSIGVATAVLLWYRDVGLGLIGWGAVTMIWALLFGWRFQGNLVELWLSGLDQLAQPSPLWWFHPLLCSFGCIAPLGIIGFLGHTVRLIVQEWQ
jgi:hypothetical protein